jgi:hypothetical protein
MIPDGRVVRQLVNLLMSCFNFILSLVLVPSGRQGFVVIFMSAGILFQTVLGIRDILVLIPIPGSVPLTDGSGSDSDFKDAKKNIFVLHIFSYNLPAGTLVLNVTTVEGYEY